jgi:DNA-binding transcriptional MerR regulator
VLTIGQVAGYAGVSTRTVRVYHDKGLLPEPERDSSGYRRYTARDAIEVVKIRTLAKAGVPLARIPELLAASDEELGRAVEVLDAALTRRVRELQATRRRLRRLAAGRDQMLPPQVADHVRRLRDWGFSRRWTDLVTDLWLFAFTTRPELADDLLRDQSDALADPAQRQIFLDYDHAQDRRPDDPALAELARRMVEATRRRYGSGELPGSGVSADVGALIQAVVNDASPAWRRIDALVREQLTS